MGSNLENSKTETSMKSFGFLILVLSCVSAETVTCEPGFTRVCPSGAAGSCPDEMFSFCPYNGSPAAAADTWACSCLHTTMLELDVQAGINPLGECHGECICISGDMEAITHKQKPAFQETGTRTMPSYCLEDNTQKQKPAFQGNKDTPSTK